MTIQFTKMHALGNDFVVVDAVRQAISVTPEWIRHLADRHRGVGCDQVLLITAPKNPAADFGYRIFNADGGEVYQCGNGARCVGLFIQQKKMCDKKIIYLETRHQLMRVDYLQSGDVQVEMGKPNFDPSSLPCKIREKAPSYSLKLVNRTLQCDLVSVGNPHCVITDENFSDAEKTAIGIACNAHPLFPEGVNVGFVRFVSRNQITLRVYERGVGMTEACGSGACAAVAVGRKKGYLEAVVDVHQMGGVVQVCWPSEDAAIQLRGVAISVFDGVMMS